MACAFRTILLLLGILGIASTELGSPVLNEFMATNQGGVEDEDGDSTDWIELHNPGPTSVNLEGWALTDVVTNRGQWRFPSTNLPAGGYLVVFASGKDRRVPGQPLHTNFRLSSSGEYLALVHPNGQPVEPVFAPGYPIQFPNVSFGVGSGSTITLLTATAPITAWVPADNSLGTTWRETGFNPVGWTSGRGGAGYESSPADYAGLIGLDLASSLSGKNTSVYLRSSFEVSDPGSLTHLRLLIQYDDGFVVWLNGQEVARRNAPDLITWNSAASANHPDDLAVIPEEIDLTDYRSHLVAGENVLAVQGLNTSLSSSDFLVRTELVAERASAGTALAYFTVPTPGEANRGGTVKLGPLIRELAHQPLRPAPGQSAAITARMAPTQHPVAAVTAFYRIRFNAEIQSPMVDDGLHGDGAAGDGVYGTLIPPNYTPGEMVRYRVVAADTTGETSRLPLFFDPTESEEYLGWVQSDPSINSQLPVFQLFVQDVGASESFAGTRATLAYLDEFYDNIEIRVHGQSSSGFPKKSFNLDFNRDHRFRYATNRARVKDLKLLTNYGDKSRLHNTLAYEVIGATGSRGHFAFPVRVQRNGAFHGIQDVVEDGDERWLGRMGLSSEGALYKVYDSLDSAGGSEKKTRRDEGSSDLQEFIDGIAPSSPLAARTTYAYDHLDLPQTISYFVGLAIISSQDHGHKNFYVHRDSTESGEWSPLPWDVDLTFGRNWTDSSGYFTDTLYTNNVLNFYNTAQQGKPANRLYTLIFSQPEFRKMYLRRLRTVMDTVLQAPGTPADQLQIEARIRAWLDLLDPPSIAQSDADLDLAKWGTWGAARNTRAEAQRIIDVYLPGRRDFLFSSVSATLNGERIPPAQAAQVSVQLDSLEFNPPTGRQAEEYLRLTNAEPVAVDISDWRLRGQIRHTFRPGTVIPPGRTLYVSPDVAAFRSRTASPKAGENHFVQGNYDGQLSARGGTVELVDASNRVVSTLTYAGAPTPLQQGLRLSEVMYHPAPTPGGPFEDEDFEFLELKNVGRQPLNLLGATFNEGVTFTFTNAATATLTPGARVLVVRHLAAFVSRYGTSLPVAGEYLGNLDNSGESLRLQDAQGETVFEFRYEDSWFASTDGDGFSLEPVSPDADLDLLTSWRPSRNVGGTPGRTSWPAFIDQFSLVGDTIQIKARAEAGNSYQLQGDLNLTHSTWEPLTPAQSGAEDSVLQFELPLSADPARFLRVGQP